jgi:hypothetical protein
VLLQACGSGNATDVLWYPGRTVHAFSQIWAESGNSSPQIAWPQRLSPQQRDASAILAISGIADLPQAYIQQGDPDSSFLAFCAEAPALTREYDDFSYVDEIRTLQIGSQPGTNREVLSSRYDQAEQLITDTLDLGGLAYSL